MEETTTAEYGRRVSELDEAQANRKQELEDQLRLAGERAASGKVARKAAIAEIGHLLRCDRAEGILVGVVGAEALTQLSRPTLVDARADTEAWEGIAEIARLALVYGYDEGPYRAELHAAFPRLGALHDAATWLAQQWRDTSGEPVDNFDLGLDRTEPADLLRDAWREAVERIAAG